MNANNNATPTGWADPDDAPELDDAYFDRADEYNGQRLIKRGRPRAASRKQHLSVRYDAEVIAAFRATGAGWQSRMNDALKDWLKDHKPGRAE